ncbi:MAG: RdgB/HAM1 family non-canonical purine NTP pyrophosphatase [Actinomycetaceae bacterium]|nr:RdgB/HAM1 family non-canonical purine NTP pyrophosphatase [Actinomycetaceae bacterium]
MWAVGSNPEVASPDAPEPFLRIPPQAQIILATNNAHKVQEVLAILRPLIPALREDGLVASQALSIPDVKEDGTSFSENALIKARAVARATTLPVLADDSGLTVDILGGAPGIFSARWCGHHGDDAANLDLLLAQLSDVRPQDRGAAFVCAAALVLPDGTSTITQGIMGGSLATQAAGHLGFGYDPIFIPTGSTRTTAQLRPEEKNAISHRGKAFAELAPAIAAALGHGG